MKTLTIKFEQWSESTPTHCDIYTSFYSCCTNCGSRSMKCKDEPTAIERWNQRHDPTPFTDAKIYDDNIHQLNKIIELLNSERTKLKIEQDKYEETGGENYDDLQSVEYIIKTLKAESIFYLHRVLKMIEGTR